MLPAPVCSHPSPRNPSSSRSFNFTDGAVELYAERVANKGLCAQAQAESLKYKLIGGLAVRRACYGVLRFIMESGAKGAEVIVSGKLRARLYIDVRASICRHARQSIDVRAYIIIWARLYI